MLPYPLTIPDDLKERYIILDKLAHRLRKDEIYALGMRVKKLRSEALKRSLDWRASGPQYAQNCIMCRGTGQAHFCPDPFCHPDNEMDKEDCLHFTPHELEIYTAIHKEYVSIICEMNDLVGTGALLPDLYDIGSPKKDHDLN